VAGVPKRGLTPVQATAVKALGDKPGYRLGSQLTVVSESALELGGLDGEAFGLGRPA
jgi:hypothetical protein